MSAENIVMILQEPSVDLATRVLREVSWEERTVEYLLKPGGPMTAPVHTLEGLATFLESDYTSELDPDQLKFPSRDLEIAYADQRAVKVWVTEVLGDEELGAAIGDLIERTPEGAGYPAIVGPLVNLLGLRLDQCKAVLGLLEDTQTRPRKWHLPGSKADA